MTIEQYLRWFMDRGVRCHVFNNNDDGRWYVSLVIHIKHGTMAIQHDDVSINIAMSRAYEQAQTYV